MADRLIRLCAPKGASEERIHAMRGALVVFGGILIHFTLGSHYTFGNMTTYITSFVRVFVDPTVTYEQASWIYTGNQLTHGVSMMVGGYLEYKFGPKLAASVGAFIFTGGVILTAFSIKISFLLVFFTYGVMFGLKGMPYVVPLTCGMRWFPERRGLVSGLILSSFGLASFFLTPMQTAFLNPDNIPPDPETKYFTNEEILSRVPNVFFLMGGIYGSMQLVGILLLSNPPKKKTETVVDAETGVEDATKDRSRSGDGATNGKKAESKSGKRTEDRRPNRDGSRDRRERIFSPTRVRSPPPSRPKTGTRIGSSSVNGRRSSSAAAETSDVIAAELLSPRGSFLMPDDGPKDDSEATREVEGEGDPSLSPKEVVRAKEFYMLFATFFLNQQAIGYISTLYKAFGLTFIRSDRFLALIGSISSISNSLGRPIWGAVSDKLGYKRSMLLVTGLLTFFFATLPFSKHVGQYMYAVWVVAIFLVLAGNYALLPSCVVQTFGPTFGSSNYGMIFASSMVSSPIQSTLASRMTPLIGREGLLWLVAGFVGLSFLMNCFYDRNPSPYKIRERLGLPAYRNSN